MSNKQSSYLKKLFLLLGGSFLAYKAFPKTNSSPTKAIEKAFKGSKFEPLIPFIIAQAKHETGDFKSEIFKNSNNMFGMKVPYIRPSLRSGVYIARDGAKYSAFKNVFDSARDQRLYFENQNFPIVNSSFEFVNQLKSRGYFGDTIQNYLKGINHWMK